MVFQTAGEHFVQVGLVHGSDGECGDANFPDIFARLEDAEVFSFLYGKKVCM